jgi:hypothetical protein
LPSTWRITPGATSSEAGYTTQPITRSISMLAVITPPGSTASIRVPSYGPGSLWKYHQGMPFCMVTTIVSGPNRLRISSAAGAT